MDKEQIKLRHNKARRYRGKIISFRPNPGKPLRFVGKCVGCRFPGQHNGTGIPDFSMKVQGRSGKVMEISMVETFAKDFRGWDEAIKYSKM